VPLEEGWRGMRGGSLAHEAVALGGHGGLGCGSADASAPLRGSPWGGPCSARASSGAAPGCVRKAWPAAGAAPAGAVGVGAPTLAWSAVLGGHWYGAAPRGGVRGRRPRLGHRTPHGCDVVDVCRALHGLSL
jgi:hypothetical protein